MLLGHREQRSTVAQWFQTGMKARSRGNDSLGSRSLRLNTWWGEETPGTLPPCCSLNWAGLSSVKADRFLLMVFWPIEITLISCSLLSVSMLPLGGYFHNNMDVWRWMSRANAVLTSQQFVYLPLFWFSLLTTESRRVPPAGAEDHFLSRRSRTYRLVFHQLQFFWGLFSLDSGDGSRANPPLPPDQEFMFMSYEGVIRRIVETFYCGDWADTEYFSCK